MHALIFLPLLPAAFAAMHTVEAGEDGKFIFNPDTLKANVGDTVVVKFYPGAHSIAQSTFDSPCQPSTGGIWSGFFTPSSGVDSNVFEITIANTDPIWLYCAQIGHCNAGMNMVINPPSGGNTLDAYKSAAANAKLIAPSTVEGGVVKAASAVSSEAASSAASTSAASASAAPTTAASTSASTSGTATASSSVAAFTGASSRNKVGALVSVIGAGIFGLAMM